MDLAIILENIGIYFEGLRTTLALVSISLLLGLVIAIPLAVLRTSKNYMVQAPIRAYVFFFRGTPLLVQMFIIYYGFGQFEAIKASFIWHFFKEAWFCALFAFTLNTGAYTTEILRGAIEATPHGEVEAARAAGMSRLLMLRRIVLPSAFRRALPVARSTRRSVPRWRDPRGATGRSWCRDLYAAAHAPAHPGPSCSCR